jgi:LysM repeat protein
LTNQAYDCDLLAADYEISVITLVGLNSWLSGNCTENLFANLSENAMRPVCINAGSSTTAPSTTTLSTSSAAPTQTGIASFCADLYTIQSGDSCDAIETKNGVTFAQLYAWNPAIGDDCQYLLQGYAICVAVASTTTSITTAAPTQTGMTSSCTKLYTVKSGDGCAAIESTYALTFAQLYAWNPAIGDDCQYLSLGYAICVAVKSTSTVTTLTSAPTETTTSVSCSEYYTVVQGDSCAAIESKYSISFAEFLLWNPSIGSNCQSLNIAQQYCVAGPVQTGITTLCTSLYTAKKDDSCWAIATAYGITTKQFVDWNPAVGGDCSGLWPDYEYCVAI